MIILFVNTKGGVGKTTLSICFANYLTIVLKKDLVVLDLDFNKSLFSVWEESKAAYANDPPYEVVPLEIEDFPNISKTLREVDGLVLVDMPNRITDNELFPIFEAADLAVIPFNHDKDTFDRTLMTALTINHVNDKTKLLFLPYKIKTQVKYETKVDQRIQLENYGKVAPAIPDLKSFSDRNTISIAKEIVDRGGESFEYIIKNYLVGKI